MADIQVLIARMLYWCDVADMGYSQVDRWDFNPAGGNCDCSSLVIHSLQEAGFDTGGATFTGNLSGELTARGWVRLPVDGNPLPGDILLNDADHVAVYVGGGCLSQASISETGGVLGAPGDQTGGETNTSPYYDYPWDCYLRYTGPQTTQGGYEDMPVKNDSIDWDGQNVSVEYALQDLKHKLDALGDAKHVSDMVWFGQGDGRVEQAPLYTLRAIQGSIEKIAQSNGLDLHDVQNAVAQGVKDGIQSIKTTVEVKR